LCQLGRIPNPQLGFLMGLFSLLDTLLDIPMAEALTQVNLAPELQGALLGTAPDADVFRNIYELICRYETADWDPAIKLAQRLNIDGSSVADAYAGSVFWVQQSLRATSRMAEARKEVRHARMGALRVLWEDAAGHEKITNAQLRNISVHGAQLQVTEQIPLRTSVSCNDLKLGITGRGSVRYCKFANGKYLVGLEFAGGTGFRDPLTPKAGSNGHAS
jgi:hypothetical protein